MPRIKYVDAEFTIYNYYCRGCERERYCHEECTHCDDYLELLEEFNELLDAGDIETLAKRYDLQYSYINVPEHLVNKKED